MFSTLLKSTTNSPLSLLKKLLLSPSFFPFEKPFPFGCFASQREGKKEGVASSPSLWAGYGTGLFQRGNQREVFSKGGFFNGLLLLRRNPSQRAGKKQHFAFAKAKEGKRKQRCCFFPPSPSPLAKQPKGKGFQRADSKSRKGKEATHPLLKKHGKEKELFLLLSFLLPKGERERVFSTLLKSTTNQREENTARN